LYPSTSLTGLTPDPPHLASHPSRPSSLGPPPSPFPDIASSSPGECFSPPPSPLGDPGWVNGVFGMQGEDVRRRERSKPRRTPQSESPHTASFSGPPSPLMELGDIAGLCQRGKGAHTCPHAFQCAKGGVNADGTMVIFERNSAFRYALPPAEKVVAPMQTRTDSRFDAGPTCRSTKDRSSAICQDAATGAALRELTNCVDIRVQHVTGRGKPTFFWRSTPAQSQSSVEEYTHCLGDHVFDRFRGY
jgi:hypothetical protein